ncbi:MAG: biopolymer transporter ExbD [Gammaproteobacteria bacterium]|nr:biopolymer transporter ExbD [Gammaproteobacteria bacterium]NIM73873.1 biopolymer transporter ExbD [Gammaproteobacteria bacterium]NIN38061.1 biopolymer transporter ExbD [Gammaproteobacteria bacterium]NIO25654.1 biopolymer transporter ExbD [Gammaproteobacteria bacterium]NIO66288.1 biopolymer transporter ExbD [Gammaproteobacteria bacterium]
MNLRPEPREPVDINLTPLIDVVFLLLIFFMVSTTFNRDSELSIELPTATAEAQERKPESIEVAIDAQGRFYVNGRQLLNTQPKTLREALRSAAGDNESPPVIISADAKTPHQAVVQIMDAARELGFVRLTFATRLVPASEQ